MYFWKQATCHILEKYDSQPFKLKVWYGKSIEYEGGEPFCDLYFCKIFEPLDHNRDELLAILICSQFIA